MSNIREISGSRDPLGPWLNRVVPPFGMRSPKGMLDLLNEHNLDTRRAIDAVENALSECPRRDVIMQAVWQRVLIVHTIMVVDAITLPSMDPEEELHGAIKDVLQHYLEEEKSLRKAREALAEAGSSYES